MAVTVQPQNYTSSGFQTGLCDCCDDCGVCCCGLFCFPCLCCSVAVSMNECFLCGVDMALRSVYRTRYHIQGSLCGDFFAHYCCMICSVCQLKRDINLRKIQGNF